MVDGQLGSITSLSTALARKVPFLHVELSLDS